MIKGPVKDQSPSSSAGDPSSPSASAGGAGSGVSGASTVVLVVCSLLVAGCLWLLSLRLLVAHLVDCHAGSSAAEERQSGSHCLSHHQTQSFLQWTGRRPTRTTCSYPCSRQARYFSASLSDSLSGIVDLIDSATQHLWMRMFAFMEVNVSFMEENVSFYG